MSRPSTAAMVWEVSQSVPQSSHVFIDRASARGTVYLQVPWWMLGCRTSCHSAVVVQVAGYKVKCMLAEPKSKRGRTETSAWSEPPSPGQQVCFTLKEPILK